MTNRQPNGMMIEDTTLKYKFEIIDLEKLWDISKMQGAKIINNEYLVADDISKSFTDHMYNACDNELGFVPSCECGAVRGVSKVNTYCKLCDTVCSSQFVDTMNHSSWIGIPDNYAPVLHPVWYQILRNWTSLSRSNTSIIDVILNPDLEVPVELAGFIQGRGFDYFYKNHKEILEYLAYQLPRTSKKAVANQILDLYEMYGDRMFTRKLPILHSSLHPIKKNGESMKYIDGTSKHALEAIIDLSCFTFKNINSKIPGRNVDRTLHGIYGKVIDYYKAILKLKVCGKNAIIRKNLLGSRANYTFRLVCTPQVNVHKLGDIILPWKVIVTLAKDVIINHLVNRHNHSMLQAIRRQYTACTKYDPLVADCIEAYMREHPNGGFDSTLGRNPTIAIGSLMKVRVIGFDTDPDTDVVSINACIVSPANIGQLAIAA